MGKRTNISLFIVLFLVGVVSSGFLRPQKTASRLVTKPELKRSIEDYIKTHKPAEVSRFIIEFRQLPDSITIPQKNARLKFQRLSKRKFKGNVILKLTWQVDQKCCRKLTINLKIRTFENVVVTGENISRGKIVKMPTLRIESRETTRLNRRVFRSIAAAVGFRSKRFISAGTILTTDNIEPVPLVKRGELITLVIKWQNISATVLAKALKDGYENDIIEVKNLDSKKRLRGKVIAEKMVLIWP